MLTNFGITLTKKFGSVFAFFSQLEHDDFKTKTKVKSLHVNPFDLNQVKLLEKI